MAQKRYQLIHKTKLVAMEEEFTPMGHARLVEARESNPRLKGARIIEIIQMDPDQVKIGTIYTPEGV